MVHHLAPDLRERAGRWSWRSITVTSRPGVTRSCSTPRPRTHTSDVGLDVVTLYGQLLRRADTIGPGIRLGVVVPVRAEVARSGSLDPTAGIGGHRIRGDGGRRCARVRSGVSTAATHLGNTCRDGRPGHSGSRSSDLGSERGEHSTGALGSEALERLMKLRSELR